ncbi:response regulator [Phenylobacterium sp.]|uniref:response regulator transcription factor n=1 Tax=Phenylobacterium sp. TaxID=1871053 RepID=UPI00286E344A|nr:response regulator [Phenylobacterium sp.]
MQARPRILVAEDDAGIRDVVRTRLEMAGYETHTARTGVEALKRVQELKPQGLVLDINMPELDGFGVLIALKARPELRYLPTLMLTARHTPDDIRRAVGLGAKDYLTKPFSENQLLARVARLLRSPIPPAPPKPSDDSVMI